MSRLGRLRRLRADEAGAAAVEFAIASCILFTLIFGIYSLGWGLYCGSDVRHGIERASRIYLTDPNTTDSAFRSRVGSYLEVAHLADISTTITRATVSSAPVINIDYSYNYSLQIPFVQTQNLNFHSRIVVPVTS